MNRVVRRLLLAFVLAAGAGAGWFGLLPGWTLTSGRVAAAASGTAISATPTPQPPPSPTPTPTPQPPPLPPPLPTTIDGRKAALSAALDRLRATYGIPGISAAMTFADGSTWVGASGMAVVAGHRPVTARTAFAAGSISKTFTAALVMSLVEDGRIGLDSPVTSYLPGLVIDPAISVRELLDHTSGLRDFFGHPAIDRALLAHRERVWTAARSLRYVGKPYFRPGTGWHYSNTNYLILGMLAEEVGGAPLAEQLRQRFFDPLGLDHTFYQALERPRGPLARGYRFSGSDPKLRGIDVSDGTLVIPFTSVVTAAGGAGSIATTAGDLVTWVRALYGGGVLRSATVATMIDDAVITTALKSSIPYGLGVQVVTIDGRPTLGHSGRLLGFRAVMRWLPDQGIAVAVLTNQSRTDPNLLTRDLLRTVLGVPPVCAGCAQRP